MKVDPANYNYIMYVDASGDDGFQFDNGSTICYAAAALLVEQSDIQHNLDVLDQIKKIVGCKANDEIKYSRIRRHRRGAEALALLKSVKGKLSCYIVFKKELAANERPANGSKALSVLCHAMALRAMDSYQFSDGDKVLIAIDRMKHTEEAPLEYQMSEGALSDKKHPERSFLTETVFRDSKDAHFLLIQLADLLSGTIREHFEQYETNEDMLYFSTTCPRCISVARVKKGRAHAMCKNGKSRATKITNSKNLKNILHLIPDTTSINLADYFFMNPTKMMNQHFYLMCRRK